MKYVMKTERIVVRAKTNSRSLEGLNRYLKNLLSN